MLVLNELAFGTMMIDHVKMHNEPIDTWRYRLELTLHLRRPIFQEIQIFQMALPIH